MKPRKKVEKTENQKLMQKCRSAAERHVLTLEADVTEQQRRELLHMSNLLRIAGNELTARMRKNLEQLKRTKKYRELMQINRTPLSRHFSKKKREFCP